MTYKPDTDATRKLMCAARDAARALPDHLPPLLYLTDPNRSLGILETAKRLPVGSAVIYRHFGFENRIEAAQHLRKITYENHCALLIGNDPLLAMSSNADGVHWPESKIEESKKWRNRFRLMTAAAHSRIALASIAKSNIDAAIVSTVFESASPSASRPMGAMKFRELVRHARVPIYALGGITAQNAGSISRVAGIAAISGIEQGVRV